jgi:hypothetical protein
MLSSLSDILIADDVTPFTVVLQFMGLLFHFYSIPFFSCFSVLEVSIDIACSSKRFFFSYVHSISEPKHKLHFCYVIGGLFVLVFLRQSLAM